MTNRFFAALVASSLLVVSGCLDVDSKLAADGSGKMTISYTIDPSALAAERAKLEGPHVKVTNAELKGNRGVFALTFDDARMLSTSKVFENVQVAIADGENGTKSVTAKIVNKKPQKFNEEILGKVGREVHISVEFPGDVTTSNATSTAGPIAKWVYATSDFTSPSEVILQATYKNAAAAGAPAAKPAGAP